MPQSETSPTPALPSVRPTKRPLRERMQWALTGLGLALLVLLVLPSAQIRLGASQLHGLIGSYTTNGHTWQVSYSSQGTTSWTGRGSGGGSQTWDPAGNGDTLPNTSGLDAKCIGTVTPTLTLVPTTGQTSATDPPPSQVLVTETGYAYFNGGGVRTDHGTLLDGWAADTPPDSPNNIYGPHYYYSASGTHYEVKDGTSGTITVGPFSLNASTPTVTDSNAGNDTVAVAASVNISPPSPVSVVLIGPIQDTSGKQHILVGQGCSASLSTIPHFFSDANPPKLLWDVSGNTFQSWNGDSGTTPVQAVLGFGQANPGGPHWYWSDTAGIKTVTCNITVTPTAGQGAPSQMTVKQTVDLQVPTVAASNYTGVGYVGPYDPRNPIWMYASPSPAMRNQGQEEGSTWVTSVSLPTTPTYTGTGKWGYAQIINRNESLTDVNGVVHTLGAQNGLDGIFPYLSSSHPSDGLPYKNGDSPALPVNDGFKSAQAADSFKTYLMFQPPGSDVQWVPLKESVWDTNFNASKPDTGWASFPPNTSVGPVEFGTSGFNFKDQTTHPSW